MLLKWQNFILWPNSILSRVCVYVCVCVCVYHIFFIYSTVDRHLGCFHTLTILNNAAMNIGVHVSFWISVLGFSGCIPSSGIAGSYGNSIFSFLKKTRKYCFWQWLYQFMEKELVPHSSALARKIPWTEEPGRLQSIGSLRVRHDWATSPSLFTFLHWRRKWQPTPVFLPGESQGQRSLVGCRLWGRTESDTTEAI